MPGVLPYTQPHGLVQLMNNEITVEEGGKEGPPFGNTSDTPRDGQHLLYVLTVYCALHAR